MGSKWEENMSKGDKDPNSMAVVSMVKGDKIMR
jgi:hypothetical protein